MTHSLTPNLPGLKAAVYPWVQTVRYFGFQRTCPICNYRCRLFRPWGLDRRTDALCRKCGSLERHRLTMLFLERKTDLFEGRVRTFLHVAPEPFFVPMFEGVVGDGYLSADLSAPGVMERMDIMAIQHPDMSFDALYCSHVLEHVDDDRRAIGELYRVLKPNGWAILNVPITVDKTFEDPSVVDPKARERVFGQRDHVRRYGPDYTRRLSDSGFLVSQYTPSDFLSTTEITKYGLAGPGTGDVFYCERPG